MPPASKSTAKRRILLVEDHPVTREGFAQLIDYQEDLQVCGQAGTAAKAISGLQTYKPDLLIVDLSLSDSNGLDLIKNVKSRHHHLPILVLSTYDESLYAERAMRAGAQGYVMKQAPTSEVMQAIRQVLAGGIYLSETIRNKLVHRHLNGPQTISSMDVDALSDRELEVFQLLGTGHSTRQVAAKLHVSVSTVETYRAHIKEKLRLSNATELVHRAVEWANRPRPA